MIPCRLCVALMPSTALSDAGDLSRWVSPAGAPLPPLHHPFTHRSPFPGWSPCDHQLWKALCLDDRSVFVPVPRCHGLDSFTTARPEAMKQRKSPWSLLHLLAQVDH